MKGWKTKTGAIIAVIGGALLAGSQVCPDESLKSWIIFAGTILASAGGGLGAYGIGHKIEKNGKRE